MGLVEDVVNKVKGAVLGLLKGMMKILLDGLTAVFIGLLTIFGFVMKPVFGLAMTIAGALWGVAKKIAPGIQYIPYLLLSTLMMPFIIPLTIISMALSFAIGKYVLLLPFVIRKDLLNLPNY